MSSFRAFLQNKQAQPDLKFEARDESYFVLAMLLLRLGFHGPAGHEAFEAMVANAQDSNDPLASIQTGTETQAALIFVTTFLCFFAVKPATFMTAIQQFKDYFIPGFAASRDKRLQLFKLVHASFSQNPLQPSEWYTLEHFFREEWDPYRVPVTAGRY